MLSSENGSNCTLDKFLESGALGLLLKSVHSIELIDAAKKVAQGEHFFRKQFSRMMTNEYIRLTDIKKSKTRTTNRERDVLNLQVDRLIPPQGSERTIYKY